MPRLLLAALLAALSIPLSLACSGASDDAAPEPGIGGPFAVTNAALDGAVELRDDSSTFSQYLEGGDEAGDKASFAFEVQAAGFYSFTAQVQAGSNASLGLRLDEEPSIVWPLDADEGWSNDESPSSWLAAGEHRLEIEFRSGVVRLTNLELLLKSPAGPSSLLPREWHVDPDGSDSGDGTAASPLQTIQKAVDAAMPGDTIKLGNGRYFEDVRTVRAGLPGFPITIEGSNDAILQGGGESRIFEVNHSYVTLQGFTIDGHFSDGEAKADYRDKLVYVRGTDAASPLLGFRLLNMKLENAGGECVRLRYFVQQAEIAGNEIGPCGVHDFQFDDGGKNGEGIYLGTSSTQWKDNPTQAADLTMNNWVHDNKIDTQGNECVDIKEGATGNLVEGNECTGQKDDDSAGFGSRGDDNVFRNNKSHGNAGSGFRLGGHSLCLNADGTIAFDFGEDKSTQCGSGQTVMQFGKNNQVYDNEIRDNEISGVLIQVEPQLRICQNSLGNQRSPARGTFGSKFKPEQDC